MSVSSSPDPKCDALPAAPAGDRVVLALAILLLAVQIGPWYYSHGDGPAYISIARHIARGQGLQNMGSPILWFSPGYPLLISPLFLLGDLPLLGISILQWLLAVGLAWGTYVWARPLIAEGAVWIAALTVGTSAVWTLYRRPISEIAFMAVMAWLLVSLDRLARARSRDRFLAWLIAAVGLTALECLIRPVGIALAAGGSCALVAAGRCQIPFNNKLAGFSRNDRLKAANLLLKGIWQRGPDSKTLSWRSALFAAVLISAAAAITVGAVVLRERWAAQPLGAETYLNGLDAKRGAAALDDYGPWFALVVSDIGRIMVPFMFKCYGAIGEWRDVNMLVYAPMFGLLFFGYVRWMRRGPGALAWSLPFYLAVLTCFRCESGARWWVPMTPALFMCLWFALEPLGRRRWKIMRALWLLHVAAALGYWIHSDLPHTRGVNQSWPAVLSLADQITSDRDRTVIFVPRTTDVHQGGGPLPDMAEIGTLFTLALDRRVREFSDNDPIPATAEWLILPEGRQPFHDERQPPPDFVRRARAGRCELFQRSR